jgi:hypothetical protein
MNRLELSEMSEHPIDPRRAAEPPGTPALPVRWRARATPLEPVAVAARGPVAAALARRLLARDDDALGRLRGVAGPGLLILLGPHDQLPWIDGVCYLGRAADAPSLFLPTAIEPDVPEALLERALVARFARLVPLAVLTDPPMVAPVGQARPIARPLLSAWIEEAMRPEGAARPDGGAR